MTVLHRKEATGIGRKGFGLGSYIVVGLIAAAIGVGAVTGIRQIVGESEATAAQQALALRGEGVGENLAGLWESGLAQQAAISEAAALQSRIDAGLIQQDAYKDLQLLQSRIEAGKAQSAAMDPTRAFDEAWEMRGAEMTEFYAEFAPSSFVSAWEMRGSEVEDHLSGLYTSGLAQKAAMADSFEAAWEMRGSAADSHLPGLFTSGLAQKEAIQNR